MQKYLLSFILASALILIPMRPARAHPADMYFHTHQVSLSPDGIRITWEMVPGPLIAQSIWVEADLNQDELVSPQEALAWSKPVVANLRVALDGTTLPLELQSVDWPSGISRFFAGEESIRIQLQGSWPEPPAREHEIEIQNLFIPGSSVSWFNVSSEAGLVFTPPTQDGGTLTTQFSTDPAQTNTWLNSWESRAPSIPWIVESVGLGNVAEQASAQASQQTRTGSILEGLVKQPERSPAFVLSALAIAILLGALHALSPGHGKTVVAAYLVGAHGRYYHAILLGALVTLTHTGSVFALGLITLTASRYLLAADIFPVLELVSGLLILFLGITLLVPRFRSWLTERQRQRRLAAGRPDGQETAARGRRLVINQAIDESGPPHSHAPSELGFIPTGVSAEYPLRSIRWQSLVTLGVSGGLVPCPDAIAILLLALTINRIAFGLSLIVAFSLGLAVILIMIGILIIRGKRLFERLKWFDRIAYTVPVLSALVVLGAGAALTVTSVRAMNAQPPGGKTSFSLQQASLLYLSMDENNSYQLYLIPARGGKSMKITSPQRGVWDYTLSPDFNSVLYTTSNEIGTSQIWQLTFASREQTLLLDCQEAFCSRAVWHPGGQHFLYSRQEMPTDEYASPLPSIWWFDLTTRETNPLFQDENLPGYSPQWSPDGKWLTYTSIHPQEVQLYQVENGSRASFPVGIDATVIWSPASDSFLLVDQDTAGEYNLLKLFRGSLETQTLSLLDPDPGLDESFPQWSPDGKWVSLVRQAWGMDVPISGNQVWLMRPDGSDGRALTRQADIYHGRPAWSPDSRYLVYDINSVSPDDKYAALHIYDTKTDTVTEILAAGSLPVWLP